jgi:hypothetical protein
MARPTNVRWGRTFWFSLALVVPVAMALGALLLRFTHHRPLGAATWTVAVLGLFGVIEATLRRIMLGPVQGPRVGPAPTE